MSSAMSQFWTIDKILCSGWGLAGNTATIWASDYRQGEVSFQLAIHPEFGTIVISQEVSNLSTDAISSLGQDGLPVGLQKQAESQLIDWANQQEIISSWISEKNWDVPRGLAVPEIQYAALAYAYSHRAAMNPMYVAELLALDMNVPISTVKERLRKARFKKFLTSPGKGLAGQGKVTTSAIKLLTEEGLLSA
jgi:hypothetical protein